jgi:Na+/phosphate symporter
MNTDNRIIRLIATLELVLIFPAALFLISVVARHIEFIGPPARQIALWYAYRFWTLWVFMISLPLAALLMGCVTLLIKGGSEEQQTIGQRLATIHKSIPELIVALSTLAAAVILVIVAVHMAMN